MKVVLNEHTGTAHKHETGAATLHTECGATYHIDPGKLRRASVKRVNSIDDLTKCGRCFDEGGGY